MASGLVLTYQTSGIFNFAHGAVAFTDGVLLLPAPHGPGHPDRPGRDPLGARLRSAARAGARPDRCSDGSQTAPVYARIVGTIGLLVALPAFALWLVESVGDDALGLDLAEVCDTASGGGGPRRGSGRSRPRCTVPHLDNVNLSTDQIAVFIVAASSPRSSCGS